MRYGGGRRGERVWGRHVKLDGREGGSKTILKTEGDG